MDRGAICDISKWFTSSGCKVMYYSISAMDIRIFIDSKEFSGNLLIAICVCMRG